jgi:Family of unknown function (DUF5995)
MESIAAELPVADGVSRFNHLYLEVTRSVDGAAQTALFEDASFMTALDVGFAGMYFNAFAASQAGTPLPRCWAPLFAARGDAHIAPIQFALAGMNAHINHDLPLALVSTCMTAGVTLDDDSPQHRDFVKINDLLAAVEQQVKTEYLTGLLGVAAEVLGRIDDVVAMWSIGEARNAAWTNAALLWAVRDSHDLTAAFEDVLDGTIGFAGRGLLLPTLT